MSLAAGPGPPLFAIITATGPFLAVGGCWLWPGWRARPFYFLSHVGPCPDLFPKPGVLLLYSREPDYQRPEDALKMFVWETGCQ